VVGFLSYFGAAISCGIAWLQARRSPRSYPEFARFALILGIIESILCLDMVFEWRFAIHAFFNELLMERNLYGGRHPLQVALLCLLGILVFVGFLTAFRRLRTRPGALLAVTGVFLSLTLYSVEIISMHETDRGLYHLVSGVMVIAFLWVLACALTLLGIRMEARSGARGKVIRTDY
jgi:hypothetical protein